MSRRGHVVESKWSLVVLVSSFLCLTVLGSLFSSGMWYVAFLDAFGETRATTAWITSMMSGLSGVVGLLAGCVSYRYSCRTSIFLGGLFASFGCVISSFANGVVYLIFSFGVITGIGMGLAYSPALMVLSYYFEKYLPLATGVASSGLGIGNLLSAYYLEYFISTFSWRSAMIYYAGILLHMCLFAALMRPVKLHEDEVNHTEVDEVQKTLTSSGKIHKVYKKSNDKQSYRTSLLKNAPFLMLAISFVTSHLGQSTIFMYLPVQAISVGATEMEAAMLLFYVGVSSTVSRVIIGLIAQHPKLNKVMFYSTTLCIMGLFTCVFPRYVSHNIVRILFCVAFGSIGHVYSVLLPPITVDVVGLTYLPIAFGLMYGFGGAMFIVSPPLAGWLYDITLSYSYAFYLGGIAFILSGIGGVIVFLLDKRQREKPWEPNVIYIQPTMEEGIHSFAA